MTSATMPAHAARLRRRRHPDGVRRLAVRQVRRGALIVTAVCAGISALVAYQYQTTFRARLRRQGCGRWPKTRLYESSSASLSALDDPGGFTVWRTGLPVLVLSSVWVLLAATRITRGEEDAGRCDLVLAGRLRVGDVVLRAMAAVVLASVLIGVAVGAALAAAGTDTTGAAVYAGAVLGVTSTFATAAIFAAQVMPTRSAAVGVIVGLLGGWLAVRMLADGAHQLAWLAWTTPFGLSALAAPYADNRVAPLLVLAGLTVGFAVAGLIAAGHRDVGGGLVKVATRRAPRTGLLKSVVGFAIRRAIRPTVGWATGIAAYYLLVGALIASILEFFDSNRRFADLATAAGFAGLDSANGFAAALFSLLAIPTGLYAATRLAAVVADEQARRWTSVLSGSHFADTPSAHRDRGGHRRGRHAACGRRVGHLGRRGDHRCPIHFRCSDGRGPEFGAGRLAGGRGRRLRGRVAAVSCRRDRRAARRGRIPAERRHAECSRAEVGGEPVTVRPPRRCAQRATGLGGPRRVHGDRCDRGDCRCRRVLTS